MTRWRPEDVDSFEDILAALPHGERRTFTITGYDHTKAQAFHDHLDVCARCSSEPFNLCDIGASLLRKACE